MELWESRTYSINHTVHNLLAWIHRKNRIVVLYCWQIDLFGLYLRSSSFAWETNIHRNWKHESAAGQDVYSINKNYRMLTTSATVRQFYKCHCRRTKGYLLVCHIHYWEVCELFDILRLLTYDIRYGKCIYNYYPEQMFNWNSLVVIRLRLYIIYCPSNTLIFFLENLGLKSYSCFHLENIYCSFYDLC